MLKNLLTTYDYQSVETPNGIDAKSSARRPGGFAIRRKKKVRPMKTGGFVIPHNSPSITKDYLTTITSSNPLPPA